MRKTRNVSRKPALFVEVLQSHGHHMNQPSTFRSDDGDTVRDLQLSRNPHAEPRLDWFHLARRLTILQQTAQGLPQTISDEAETYRLRAIRGCGRWNG
jgi:hypothetical protein